MMDLIPSLERVFKQFLESTDYRPMTRSEIAAALSLGPDRRRELRLLLRRMREGGDLVLLRKSRWARPDSAKTVTGRLSVHTRGHGTIEDPRRPGLFIRVEADAMRNAIHGDLVEVDPLPARRFGHRRRRHPTATDTPEAAGRIVRVIDRGHPVLSGLLKKTQYYWYLIPANPRFPNTVRVRDAAPGVVRVDGHMAAVRLDPWSPFDPLLSGCLIEVMGRPDDPSVDMMVLMRQYGLMDQHPREAMEEAGAIAPAIHESTLKGRTDLRDALTITIDPIDAKDFDDAVSLVRRTDGAWVLDVHIADVAHHVRPGSAIDKEAGARGTSVYLVDRTVPMLPHDLTTDVCSLRPDCDRLCHTVRMVLDSSGRTLEESTFRSVIRSRYRLDYDAVQAMIDDPPGAKAPEEMVPVLRDMRRLASTLRRARLRSGAIGFTLPEVRVELDPDGRVRSIMRRGAVEAYSLIEEFMLLANRAVARRMARARVPAMYRIHDPPDETQWVDMADALAELGVRDFSPDPAGIRRLLETMSGTPLEVPVAVAILRRLKRAEYSPRCAAHFGLAFKPYTHFTSPIRRYPDLVVHRILCAMETGDPPPYSHDAIARIAAHASRMERAADDAERESVAVKRIQYYLDLLDRGETGPYPALVTGRMPRGVLIEIVDTLQRGLIPSYFVAEGRPAGLRPGHMIDVEILKVDTHRKLVDFRPTARPPAPAAAGERTRTRGKRNRQRIR